MTNPPQLDEARSRARLQEAVGDAYEVVALLGRGGFAEVFEARDPRLDRPVAVKVLRPDISLSPAALERFQLEARAIARLRHPNVVDVYTVGQRDGVAYYVMPLIRGETLGARLQREGRIAPTEAERILLEAAAGLGAAHAAGLVHRDVKPDNILLESDGDRVVLTDFGIAKAVESEGVDLTQAGVVLGTPHFLSPEQATGEAVDHRSDLYSLGVVGYRMVSGALPLDAPTPRAVVVKHLTEEPEPLRELRPDCPENLARVIHRCLAKDPGGRFESVAELTAALRGETPGAWGAGPAVSDVRVEDVWETAGPRSASSAAYGVRARGAPGRAGERAGPHGPLEAIRVGVLASGLVAAGALATDLLVTGGLGFSLPVVLVAATFAAAGAGRLRRAGWGFSRLFRSRHPPAGTGDGSGTGGYGGHAEVVRGSRSSRAAILRLFQKLSRVEQDRFPDLLEAVDAVALGIERDARRLATLEERQAELTGAGRARPRGGTGEVLAGEIAEARERIEGDLAEGVEALEQIRHWLVRSGGADSEAVHDQLVAAVGRARAATRRRDA